MNFELIFLAIFSGLFAAFSPCSLPVYPILLNMIAKGGETKKLSILAFTIGLTIMFTFFYICLAAAVTFLGEMVLEDTLTTIYRLIYVLVALVCLLFALKSLGKIGIWGQTFGFTCKTGPGLFGAFLTGTLFATAVSSCNLPFLLAGILPLLSVKATVFEGFITMLAFSASLSLPMLILGLLSNYALDRYVKKHLWLIEKISAVFLVLAALYFLNLTYQSYQP